MLFRSRPATLELEPDVRWYRLDILASTAGGPFDADGTAEFRAFYRSADGAGSQHEVSRFVREDGAWLYVAGVTS